MLGIFAGSEVKDGAFEYLKYILTDVQYYGIDEIEYGGGLGNEVMIKGFPVNSKAMDKMVEYYIKYYPLCNPDLYTIHGKSARVPVEEDIRKVCDLIHSITVYQNASLGILGIVWEEIPAFFNSQKTVVEVAEIIQNRASIFLAESR